MSDGVSDMRSQDDRPPYKGWDWHYIDDGVVNGDTWKGWDRRGVKLWLVYWRYSPATIPKFQRSWECGPLWVAPATEDLQPMAWPEFPTYTVVTREEFYGHMAAGGRWERWHDGGWWDGKVVWGGLGDRDKKRAVDEHGIPCRLRRVKNLD